MSKSPVTAESLRAILIDGREDTTIPRALLAFFQRNHNKTLTARMVPALQAIAPDARISKRAGMTHVEWGGYGRTGGNQGGSFLIAHTEGAPTIDAVRIEDFNRCYLSAADERNEARRHTLDARAHVFQQAADAINALRNARATLDNLTDYGGDLYEARSEISALVKED